MKAMWSPVLAGRSGPKARQIADAIAEDVRRNVLNPGDRLHPQRDLADVLGLSPNTISRGYAEAIARGYLQGEVGRGTFVLGGEPLATQVCAADMMRAGEGPVDLSRNLPAPGESAGVLAKTLETLQRSSRLPALLDYQTGNDLAHHLEAGQRWLARCGVQASSKEIVQTCGAQHGILTVLAAVCRPGDVLLAEALTYAPFRAMAGRLGLKLAPLDMDGQGVLPEALEDACRERRVRALYCMPNIQTPTTCTMTEGRRRQIAGIAREYDLLLIQ